MVVDQIEEIYLLVKWNMATKEYLSQKDEGRIDVCIHIDRSQKQKGYFG